MSTNKPWAHLPNAKHIDAVLEDAKARPEVWRKCLLSCDEKTRQNAFQDAIYNQAGDRHIDEIWSDLCSVAEQDSNSAGQYKNTAWDAVTDTLAALVFWDSSATLLECTPDVLRTMIDLAEPPVCHQAALLLPYAIVRFGE